MFWFQFSLLFLILLPCTAVKSLVLPFWEHSCGRGSCCEVFSRLNKPQTFCLLTERPYPA